MAKKARKKTKTKPSSLKKTKKKKSSGRDSEEDEKKSKRGLWTGAISFGLINIPIKVVSAKERPSLHFMMLDPSNLSPVGYKYYNKSTGEEVQRSRTVKAFEYQPDQYVIMSDGDFKKANPVATQTIDIENFVALDEIDPVYFEKAYYLLPQKNGQKAYQLLCEALHKTEKVAIAKIVLHTKQHLVALMSRGKFILMELLHFAEDVKELSELVSAKPIKTEAKTLEMEVSMAEKLIEDMSRKWDPYLYKDTYRDDIMKLVKAKVRAGKATEITEDYESKSEDNDTAQVTDLLPLLRKSLATKKKLPPPRHYSRLH